MKLLPRSALLALALLGTFVVPARAGVELQDDGTYVISGLFTFWPEKNILAPTGKFDTGEFSSILFKPGVNEFPGVREMKKSLASFQVNARAKTGTGGEKILVVEAILARTDDAGSDAAASQQPKR